ncbi:MAG: dTDP-4-dehydrorhamnose 3,5-epimerase family protein [Candidatus Omnitrophica bacterium]|nr:dTDP-4-dehydrorhamnose 3,5-epimerase family protein [Candidatus Omnitrophota bacterium]MBU1933541.1 dTDP-4-dehydrorhamnose 3,5-epimerase family protein [Candidatus Omnitrophota bacterium]
MIHGVQIKKLKIIPDERGRLMEILRSDEEIFQKFGQVYMTTAFSGVTKAWHYHKKQDDHFTCISGVMKLALYDSREGSPTKGEVNDFTISLDNPSLVKIPKLVYHGFKCVSDKEAVVINVPTMTYNYKEPDEYRVDAFENDIPYDWRKA